jgi:hypothetical protein
MTLANIDPSSYLTCALNNKGYLSEATPAASIANQTSEQKLLFAIAQGIILTCLLNNYVYYYRISKLSRSIPLLVTGAAK